uniref:Putative divalent-cation tolerance protein CutA n=1 Tax=Magnetococcus massalia (strain MO-1) TaxID=451514 RepID=A0A1S7LNS8_MAGMO|nr:putative divalent-cation tolerance protein CutA [Candidatus Magnetococcus massalia]
MEQAPQGIVIWCSVPDEAQANRLAELLITEQLAACVHAMPAGVSTYRWQGKVERESEILLMIKTRPEKQAKLLTTLQAAHPYDVPEIIVTPITEGAPGYMQWLKEAVQ